MAAFIAALPAFIAVLPSLLTLAVRLMTLAGKIAEAVEKNNLHAWLDKVEGSIDGLEKADTPEKKLASARELSRIMRGLS